MKKIIFLLILFFQLVNCLKAQVNTFSFLYKSRLNKVSLIPVEDSDNNYILPMILFTGKPWAPSDIDRALLMKFTPKGDTSCYYYTIPDSAFSFQNIIKTSDDGYLVAGASKAIITRDSVNLLLIKLNNKFEIEWKKHYYLYGNWEMGITKIFPLDDNDFILAGMVTKFPSIFIYPYLVRIDQYGNIARETIYSSNCGSRYEYLLNSSKTRILMFANGLPPHSNGLSVTIFDTTFTYLSSHVLPVLGIGVGGNPFHAKWLNDTNFIFSYQKRLVGSPFDDKEFTIQIHDTLFNLLQFDQFGLPDSYDCPAWVKGFDFRHPDTIFYAANTGLALGPPPSGYTNWFMVRQTDGQLKERYRHFYGGDSFYFVDHIIATSDGGCFVGSRKFDFGTGNFELLFLKLNSDGMLVGTNDPDIQQRMSLLYPNPAYQEVVLETYLDESTIKIFNVDGRTVGQYSGVKGRNAINLNGLPAGVYVLSLYAKGKFIENYKFIKNP